MQWLTQGLNQLSLESMGAFQLVLQQEFFQQSPSHAGNYLSSGKPSEKNIAMFIILNGQEMKGPCKIMQFQPAKKKTLQ